MNCKKCGKELDASWITCPYCGRKAVVEKKRPRRGNGLGGAYKRGKTWTARVTVGWKVKDGRPVPIPKTKGGFKSETEALRYCSTLLKDPQIPKYTETLRQLYDRWEAFYAPRIDEQTMKTYVAAFKWFKSVEHRPIVDLTTAELQSCIDACPRGRSTLDNMRTVCGHVFRYAESNKIPVKNLSSFLYTASVKKGTRRAFTDEEFQRIKNAVGVLPYADYVYCFCYFGWRPNEMLSMPKARYDAEHRCLIGGFKTPAGTDRIVTISPKVQFIIDAQMRTPGEWLFPEKENWQLIDDEYFLRNCFKPLMDRLGIEGTTTYSCRHTFSNLLKKVPGSDTDKAALMGHADASMTKYYQSADYASLLAITDSI